MVLGFMLQDRAELFSLQSGHPNVYAPGRRPFQTIIPAFALRDGQPWLSFGVMGGDMQPQGARADHRQSDRLRHGSCRPQATPRAIASMAAPSPPATRPMALALSRWKTACRPVRAELERRGHRIRPADGSFGGYQAIMRHPNGVYEAATEMRKDGTALAAIDAVIVSVPRMHAKTSARPTPSPPPLKRRGRALGVAIAARRVRPADRRSGARRRRPRRARLRWRHAAA
jgi:gamma-glutamyltranspeptidase